MGLKTHDSHILLQRLLPIGIRAYLKKNVSTAIVELCKFFCDLCAKTISICDLDRLQGDIVIVLFNRSQKFKRVWDMPEVEEQESND